MQNRDGDFVLVFEPADPDLGAIPAGTVSSVTLALEAVFSAALTANSEDGNLREVIICFTASPEAGSIRFPSVATWALGIGIAAGASQISGVSLATVYQAMRAHYEAHRNGDAGAPSSTRANVDPEFLQAMQALDSTCAKSGCPSIRIEAPPHSDIELVPKARTRQISGGTERGAPTVDPLVIQRAHLGTQISELDHQIAELESSMVTWRGEETAVRDQLREERAMLLERRNILLEKLARAPVPRSEHLD